MPPICSNGFVIAAIAHYENGMLMVHAGVVPQWDVSLTLELADELQRALRAPNWKETLAGLYGNEPSLWTPQLKGIERLRVTCSALTRVRFCNAEGAMDFSSSGGLNAAPPGCMPWFDVPWRKTADVTVVFGHWAALGLMLARQPDRARFGLRDGAKNCQRCGLRRTPPSARSLRWNARTAARAAATRQRSSPKDAQTLGERPRLIDRFDQRLVLADDSARSATSAPLVAAPPCISAARPSTARLRLRRQRTAVRAR